MASARAAARKPRRYFASAGMPDAADAAVGERRTTATRQEYPPYYAAAGRAPRALLQVVLASGGQADQIWGGSDGQASIQTARVKA